MKRQALADSARPSSRLPGQLRRSVRAFCRVIEHRSEQLFTHFLPQGYLATTLSGVDPSLVRRVLMAKVHLGMLITLYDDLADSPERANPALLHELYKLPFRYESVRHLRLSPRERQIVELARDLAEETFPILLTLPNFQPLSDLLRFDLEQFFNANRYAELISKNPLLASGVEASFYTSYNMGMVLVGTMDLMATPKLIWGEVPTIRKLLLLGQRYGRICNLLSTLQRELQEGDVTNEIVLRAIQSGEQSTLAVRSKRLRSDNFTRFTGDFEEEREECLRQIQSLESRIKTLSVAEYMGGLRELRRLHESLVGVI